MRREFAPKCSICGGHREVDRVISAFSYMNPAVCPSHLRVEYSLEPVGRRERNVSHGVITWAPGSRVGLSFRKPTL